MIPDAFLGLVAERFRILGDETRLGILRALMEGERSVGEVVEATRQGQANVSKHLKVLAETGMVERRKAGLQVFYRIGDPMVHELCEIVCRGLEARVRGEMERHRQMLEGLEAGRATTPDA